MPDGPDIALSHFSLRYATIEERVGAAAGAGFSGIGIFGDRYQKWLDRGWTPSGIAALLDDHGLVVTELEAVRHWAGTTAQRATARQQEEVLYGIADQLGGAAMSLVGDASGADDELAELFAAVCDRAAGHGLRVGIECAAPTGVPDIAAAVAVVRGAGRANGGLYLDTWHFFRGGADWSQLGSLRGDEVVMVQLNDGPLRPEDDDYLVDNMVNRRVPGQGEFDLVRFVGVLHRIGSSAPIAVEVISAELQGLSPGTAAARLAAGTRQLLLRAGLADRPSPPPGPTSRSTRTP